MEKKLKKILKALDSHFGDFGEEVINGVIFNYGINEHEDRPDVYVYFAPELGVTISSDLYNQNIFIEGDVKAIKKIYKTLCKQ